MQEILKVLIRPVITEKTSSLGSSSNSVVFEVAPAATKGAIKKAIEAFLKVDVDSVRTYNLPYRKKVKKKQSIVNGKFKVSKRAVVKINGVSASEVLESL